jgi:predicted O-methyltransferase YrrM
MGLAEARRRCVGRALRWSFFLGQMLGIHVTRKHFYSPIPDTRLLKGKVWSKRSSLLGVEINEQGQLELLREFAQDFKVEYEQFPRHPTGVPHQYYVCNTTFGSVDGEILYCVIRRFKPRRIIEIGSGNSTTLAAQAILKNQAEHGIHCELIALEPYPSNLLKAGFPGLTELVQSRVEEIPLSEFKKLNANDILFIDSSHVLRIGGDVRYEYLEILPSLNAGVLVHAHDIFLPAEYPREWVFERQWFFSEQYLLQAFLAFNVSFEVLWAGNFMHLTHPDKVETAFSSYDRQKGGGSFWMRKTA